MAAASSRGGDKTAFVTGVLSLRGILALIVATAHTLGFTTFVDPGRGLLDQPSLRDATIKLLGAIDVPALFFVISGLAIARSLDRKEKFGQGLRTYLIFVLRRILRLYPAHTVSTIVVLGLAWLLLMDRPAIDFSAYPSPGSEFLFDWLNGKVFNPLKWRSVIGNFAIASWSMNLVVWSLYVEVCAIPILPLLHRLSKRNALILDVAMIAGLGVLAIMLWDHVAGRYAFTFYLGMLIQTRGKACARRLADGVGGAGRAAALCWAIMFATAVWPAETPQVVIIQASCAFALISMIVWRDDDKSFGVLDHPRLYWNGRMSYSFYLYHYFILTVVIHHVYSRLAAQTALDCWLLLFAGIEIFTVAAALAIAQLSYSYIEEPFIHWGLRLESRWRPALAPRLPVTTAPAFAAQAGD